MTKRPVNLSLWTMHFPVMAIVSILHRASGVVLFLFIPALLAVLDRSLKSEESFNRLALFFSHSITKFFIWSFLVALLYHVLAGIRHLVMDIGIAETLRGGKNSSFIVLGLSGLGAVMLGVWLWH